MPDIDEHAGRTLKKYGVEGRDIHQWLDEPSRKFGGVHREFRHDTETIRLVGEVFGSKYGKAVAENIALDHIMADHEEEVKKRHSTFIVQLQKSEVPSVPCPYCGTLLKPSDQSCPHCGATRRKMIEEFDRAYELEKLKLQEKRKELRKELKHELELSKMTIQERRGLQAANRLHRKQDPILDKMVERDLEEHPEIKEQIKKDERIAYAVVAIWLIPSVVLGVINLTWGVGWFIGFIFLVFFLLIIWYPPGRTRQ